MKGHTYINVVHKSNLVGSYDSNNTNKYRTLIDRLVQLGSNDLPKFQELLKRTYIVEGRQTDIVKLQEPISNQHAVTEVPTVQNIKSLPKANISRHKSQRSPIRPPNLKIDLSGKFPPKHNRPKKNYSDTHMNNTG